MRIINFGSCNIDYVYRVSHFVKAGETIGAEELNRYPGGKGLNQSIAIARSGTKVYHAGCIGKDGEFLRELLADAGVDVSYLKTIDASTGHAIIQVDDKGENSIILHGGANHGISRDYMDAVLENFTSGDVLVLQNEINHLDYIIERASDKGMQIIWNPSPFQDTLLKIDLNKISVLILNEVEAYAFSGKKIPEEIASYFLKNYENLKIVLTLGAKGSFYIDKDNLLYCPAYCVEAKDTTSAGDTFTGYYIAGLMQQMKTEEILQYASAAAALAVSREGAASSIPVKEEVAAALIQLKPGGCGDGKTEKQKACVQEYIQENLDRASLAELADRLGYSVSYAAAWIKKYLGMSFTALLQNARCEKAGQLLRETNLSIDEIVKMSGYENGSFFRRIFFQTYGKTPLEYRKFYQEGRKTT